MQAILSVKVLVKLFRGNLTSTCATEIIKPSHRSNQRLTVPRNLFIVPESNAAQLREIIPHRSMKRQEIITNLDVFNLGTSNSRGWRAPVAWVSLFMDKPWVAHHTDSALDYFELCTTYTAEQHSECDPNA